MAVLCTCTLTCKASVRQVPLREQFNQHGVYQRATSCCCRNYVYLFWQARIWQDYDQDAGKPCTWATWHTLTPMGMPGVDPLPTLQVLLSAMGTVHRLGCVHQDACQYSYRLPVVISPAFQTVNICVLCRCKPHMMSTMTTQGLLAKAGAISL